MHSEEYYLFPHPANLYGSGPHLRTNQEFYLLCLVAGTGDRTELLAITSAERFDLGFADSSLCTGTPSFLSTPPKTFSDMNERKTWMSCLLTDLVATEGTVI